MHRPGTVLVERIVDRAVEQAVVIPYDHVAFLDRGEPDVLGPQDAGLDVVQEGADGHDVVDDLGLIMYRGSEEELSRGKAVDLERFFACDGIDPDAGILQTSVGWFFS